MRGTGLAPHEARIDQAGQPQRASACKRRPQREPLQGYVHELRRPCGDAATGVGRVLIVIDVAISTAFSPEACTQPQQPSVWAKVEARQLAMRGAQPLVTRVERRRIGTPATESGAVRSSECPE